jgi:predicted enzyme related to lactoylglutathione lyase
MLDIFWQVGDGPPPPGGRTVPRMDTTDDQIPYGTLAHFAVNADDPAASRRFYEACFGWRFEPWGPPGFFHIRRSDGSRPGPIGALQQRRELAPGLHPAAFECTIAVADTDAVADAANRAGGAVLMARTTIAGVGDLVFLRDPAGNAVGAMRYDSSAG